MLNTLTTPDLPSFDAVDQALRRMEAPVDPAEIHGSLCGLICVLGNAGKSVWLAETLADMADYRTDQGLAATPASLDALSQSGTVLDVLVEVTAAALEATAMSFQPLLPDDEGPLGDRVDGLAQWCQGFNHGLFVAARIGDAQIELESGDTAEIVRDFSELAQAATDGDTPDAEGEAAYFELVEYVRVSVQLVYEEFTAVRQRVHSAVKH
ncbi:MAG: UPF0149 family protein [Gammaproteobacteria bacterium]